MNSIIQSAALAAWPREMCGVVAADGMFYSVTNESYDPCHDFIMPADTWSKYSPLAVVHSHIADNVSLVTPGLPPDCPTREDMDSQIASAIPWAIVVTDAVSTLPLFSWGDDVLDEPLLGRPFRHGTTDCYAAIRAWYWQTRSVLLPDFARECYWWEGSENLYVVGFPAAGFERIPVEQAKDGDTVLMQIGKTKSPNHAAVIIGNGLIYHHPMPSSGFGRAAVSLSRREPIGARRPYVTHALRYAA